MRVLMMFLVLAGSIGPVTAEPVWQTLWPGQAPGPAQRHDADTVEKEGRLTRIARPEVMVFPGPGDRVCPALVVFPGGGYGILAMEHEGREVAAWANGLGLAAVVVKYRVSNRDDEGYQSPWPLVDAQRAVALTRHQAKEWNIDPDRIGVMGFSAGGHLAAMTAICSAARPELGNDAVAAVSARPDFAMLIYPVIAMDADYGHAGSKRRLLGENPTEAVVRAHCPARWVEATSPPLFMVHAADDRVSPLNSLDMVRAAHLAGVPVEFHLYADGGHGYGLRRQGKASDAWPAAAASWLKARKIVP